MISYLRLEENKQPMMMYLHEQFTKEREIGGREFGGGGVRLIANAGIVDFEGTHCRGIDREG